MSKYRIKDKTKLIEFVLMFNMIDTTLDFLQILMDTGTFFVVVPIPIHRVLHKKYRILCSKEILNGEYIN